MGAGRLCHVPVAIFFDGDDTLSDFQAVMRRALASTVQELRRLRPGTENVAVDDLIPDRDHVAGLPAVLDRLTAAR